jgi:ATP-dependent helicase HrpB
MNPLPIDAVLPELCDVLRDHPCAVLRAPTGAGKTTRVPPALRRAGIGGGKQVLMLEPRRLAARAAARRIASELGKKLGDEVGYHVRFERVSSPRTEILVVTEGLLVRMLQDDPFLERIGVVVFDEFHERNLDTDLALAFVRKVQLQARPDLKLLVMSATIAAGEIARWLDGAPAIESEGRLHPVETTYLDADDSRPLHRCVAAGVERALAASSGDVLAFLPGVGEIRRTREELESLAKKKNVELHELYGDLPSDRQDAVLQKSTRRKIVLSTNVAETSVTIDGVTAVVDSGFARILRYDPGVGLDRLELDRISRASADQRAGRAGRTEPGIALRLWTEREQRSMREHEEPEIRRVDLTGAALQLLCFGETDLASFDWFEAPSRASLDQALSLLESLGAVANGRPTALGQALARLPAHPRIARLLLEGRRRGCAREAALAGALLSERDPFLKRPNFGAIHGGSGTRGIHQAESDVYERVLALDKFDRSGITTTPIGDLNPGAASFVLRARDALLSEIDRTRDVPRKKNERGDENGESAAPSRQAANPGSPNDADTIRGPSENAAPNRSPSSEPKAGTPTTSGGTPMTSSASAARFTSSIATTGLRALTRSAPFPEDALMRALLTAYPDRVARKREPKSRRGVMVGGRGVRLVDESAVNESELFVCLDIDAGKRGERAEAIVRSASAIEREWLALEKIRTAIEIGFEEERETVVATRRVTYDDLVLEEAQVVLPKEGEVARVLAKAALEHIDRVMPQRDEDLDAFLRRLRSLRQWMPALELPAFEKDKIQAWIPELCESCRSFEELRKLPWIELMRGKLTHEQLAALDREAPERIQVPSGSRIKIDYEPGRAPVLAARIQELFGLADSPRVAGGKVRVVMHLLAPNGRPQQVTDDLKSFWNKAYNDVRKDLRARYPRHAWPEDPWNAQPERRPKRR